MGVVHRAVVGTRVPVIRRRRIALSAAARDLEERLTKALGGPVELVEDPDGKKSGTITIRYIDLDHLDRLLEKLL